MAIRPIDYQILIPKTQQLSKESQILSDKLRLEHQQLVQQDQKSIQLKMRKINEFENKDSPKIKDYREKNHHNHSGQKQQKQQKNKKSSEPTGRIGTKIDLKV